MYGLDTTDTTSSQKRFPRRKRFGGYFITGTVARDWASRIIGYQLSSNEDYTLCMTILDKFQSTPINFREVGEIGDGSEWMVITQCQYGFNGYMDMDPKDIPQFVEGPNEVVARRILEEEGITDFEFRTVLD